MDSSGGSKSSRKRRSKGKRASEGSGEENRIDQKGEVVPQPLSERGTKTIGDTGKVKQDSVKGEAGEVLPSNSLKVSANPLEVKLASPAQTPKVQMGTVTVQEPDAPVKEKSREEVKAEREAKKLAKQMRKKGNKEPAVMDHAGTDASVAASSTKPGIHVPEKPMQTMLADTIVKVASATHIPMEDEKKDKPEKSKAELRAERRAKQEAQRAEKEAQKKGSGDKINDTTAKKDKVSTAPAVKVASKPASKELSPKLSAKEVQNSQAGTKFRHKLFDHLAQKSLLEIGPEERWEQAIVELGAKFASRIVAGSTARTVALLVALRQLVADHKPAAKTDFARSLDGALGKTATRLARARPPAVAMANALRHLKSHVNHLSTNPLPDEEAKKKLCEVIDTYIKEQVDVACLAICNTVQQKISDGDVILTYGCSSVVLRAMEQAHRCGKRFSVVVADGGPWYEGREMLRRLAELAIPTSYVLVTAASFVARKVHKVMLGAHALLANGCVMARAGTSLVALTAHARGIPVLVLCETHKFSDRVQADAFVYNELGEEADMPLEEGHKNLTCLSLVYDLTPPEFVTAVVTELAILPCTSVPVVLRVKPADIL